MKLLHSPRGGRIIKGIIVSLSALNIAFAAGEAIPTGTLTVDRTLVRVGAKSQLGWNINYPNKAVDLIDKDNNGTCTTKTKVRMQVRILAAAFSNNTTYRDVTGYVVVGTTTTQIFYGYQPNVNSSTVVYDKVVNANTKINVRATTWDYTGIGTQTKSMSCSTAAADKSVVALYDGEALPAHQATAYPNMQLNALDYIANYMNSNNTANIGDNQVIFLGDFNGFGNTGYDLNDYVLLVTFTPST